MMEYFTDNIIKYFNLDKNRTLVEICKMRLGLQVLIHNIVMIGSILVLAYFLGIYKEAIILLIAYGGLKMSAGGIHLKRSSLCVFFTTIFVIGGVGLAREITFQRWEMYILYLISAIVIYMLGPQGTENNPISKINYKKLKRRSIIMIVLFAFLSFFTNVFEQKYDNLLLIATVFEACSLIPNSLSMMKNAKVKCDTN